MQIPFKKDSVEFNQRAVFATNVFDLIPSDHACYVYGDIFEQLDTSSVEEKFSVRGQNAYHPGLITAILRAEPVFGQIKNSGFRGFSMRGYDKSSGEFSLACAVHNFKKIVKAISGGKVCLESEGLAPMVA